MKNMQKRLGGYAQIFTKVLDLPRFGRLEDRLWRRANELLLAAKYEDCGGELPSVADMAWLLNVPQLQPVQELEALKDSGLVASTGATWHYREALVAPSSFKDPEYFKVRLLISILHNPNFGTLSDRIWRRMIEFILLGAENRREGVLPDIKDIAWRIRTTESDIDACLSTLAEKGLAEKNDTGCWTIKDFAIFRNSLSDVERKRQQREKEAAESAGSQDGTPESQAVADERPDGMRATRGPDDAFKPKSVAST